MSLTNCYNTPTELADDLRRAFPNPESYSDLVSCSESAHILQTQFPKWIENHENLRDISKSVKRGDTWDQGCPALTTLGSILLVTTPGTIASIAISGAITSMRPTCFESEDKASPHVAFPGEKDHSKAWEVFVDGERKSIQLAAQYAPKRFSTYNTTTYNNSHKEYQCRSCTFNQYFSEQNTKFPGPTHDDSGGSGDSTPAQTIGLLEDSRTNRVSLLE